MKKQWIQLRDYDSLNDKTISKEYLEALLTHGCGIKILDDNDQVIGYFIYEINQGQIFLNRLVCSYPAQRKQVMDWLRAKGKPVLMYLKASDPLRTEFKWLKIERNLYQCLS